MTKLFNLFLSFFIFHFSFFISSAQVSIINGPALENDRDNTMNRMLGGDENNFYCYRVRWKGKGTSFNVEKYDKASLKPLFSKEINMPEEGETKIEDVQYANNNVYVFRREYDKKLDKMTLYYQTISSSGKVGMQLNKIVEESTDHYEFIDFDIYPNPSKTKFLIKVSHKPNKEAEYTTDFILLDALNGMKEVWKKSINQRLFSDYNSFSIFGISWKVSDIEYIGLHLDDSDNFYYCYTSQVKNSTEKAKRYRLNLSAFDASSSSPKSLELLFDDDYYVGDIEFAKSGKDELVVGGFLKDVIERVGKDLVKVGIFSFKINTSSNTILSNQVKMFDGKMLYSLESNPKRSRYFKYKLDYILPVGNDVFYVGEQYKEELVTTYNAQTRTSSSYWDYEYMDVIVAKLNAKGEFEWIKNAPLRQGMKMKFAHVFKQYIAIATNKNIYILNNDHEKNLARYEKSDFEPKDLKTMVGIHGSNFVYSAISVTDGSIKHALIFANETYCFAPIQERNPQFIPPSKTEIFVPGKENEIYIYTEDRGRDRFAKMTFE